MEHKRTDRCHAISEFGKYKRKLGQLDITHEERGILLDHLLCNLRFRKRDESETTERLWNKNISHLETKEVSYDYC